MTSLDLIKHFEGCRLKAYQDQKGVWTIGWGSTGVGIGPGVEWTQEEADQRLQKDVEAFEEGVKKLVKVQLNQNQLAALTSFAYNCGLHNLATSHLLRALNSGQNQVAADQFLLWDRAGAYVSAGLKKRREEERKVFLS